MSEFNITVPGGESKRLKTGGKYCPADIVVTAEGGGGGYDEGYENGFTDGEASVFVPSKYCRSIQFHDLNLFGTETVTVDLDNAFALTNLFALNDRDGKVIANTTVKHFILNMKTPVTEFLRVFGSVSYLERLTLNVDLSQATKVQDILWSVPDLKIIDGKPLDCTGCTSFVVFSAPKLEEIRYVAGTIKLRSCVYFPDSQYLSAESIQSIIDGLADLTGQTAQEIPLHKNVVARMTEEQKATITAKNWTLVY